MPTTTLERTTFPVAIPTTPAPDLGLIPPPRVSLIAAVGGLSLAALVLSAAASAEATTYLIRRHRVRGGVR